MRRWTNDEFIEIVKNSKCYKDICKQLNYGNGSGGYKTVKKYIELLNLDVSHFLSRSERMKLNNPSKYNNTLSNEEVFVKSLPISNSLQLKKRILRDNLFTYECKICKISSWEGKELSLHLDHINGDNSDHRLENLRFLCPNCHSQTSTYAGRNINKNNKSKIDKEFNKIKHCPDCNELISQKSNHCEKCYYFHRKFKFKINWLPLEELKEKLKNSNYTQLSKEFGISDNAIRKHIIAEENRLMKKSTQKEK